MPKYAAKVDKNQGDIVGALRAAGVSVQPLHAVGGGVPDLLCGHYGKNVLVEVKYGKGKLTPVQEGWHEAWRGQVAIVRDIDEALAAMGIEHRGTIE